MSADVCPRCGEPLPAGANFCPNCGAPLDLDLAGICKYCRAPVMSGAYDWVLTRIEQVLTTR